MRKANRGGGPAGARREVRPRDGPIVGVDIGATKIVWAVGSRTGRILYRGQLRFHGNESQARVVDEAVEAAREGLSHLRLAPPRIGVGVAAQVDRAGASVVHAPNLGWRNVPLARLLSKRLHTGVRLINDAQAAAFAEWKFGAGRGCADMFLLSLGTGIGGGAVVDGRLLRGAKAAVGEIGHVTIVSGGRRCHCGNVGCLEAHAGGWALAEQAEELARSNGGAANRRFAKAAAAGPLTARWVIRKARGGDRLARELVRRADGYLADGVVSVANAFNPERVVLVGGLLSSRPDLASRLERAVRSRCQPPAARARVVRGRLDPYATALGAAAWAAER